MNRNQFLKQTSLAGIAGLSCAYELMKLGHEVVVLEASGRYGGTDMMAGRTGYMLITGHI